MKVNVTYSVELGNIPYEISERVGKVKKDLSHMCDRLDITIKDLEEYSDVSSTLRYLDETKTKTIECLNKLTEYSHILAEYQRVSAELYLADQKQQETPSQQQQLQADVGESSVTPDMLKDISDEYEEITDEDVEEIL